MPAECNLFDPYTSQLSETGKLSFWKEVNKVLEDFDRSKGFTYQESSSKLERAPTLRDYARSYELSDRWRKPSKTGY